MATSVTYDFLNIFDKDLRINRFPILHIPHSIFKVHQIRDENQDRTSPQENITPQENIIPQENITPQEENTPTNVDCTIIPPIFTEENIKILLRYSFKLNDKEQFEELAKKLVKISNEKDIVIKEVQTLLNSESQGPHDLVVDLYKIKDENSLKMINDDDL